MYQELSDAKCGRSVPVTVVACVEALLYSREAIRGPGTDMPHRMFGRFLPMPSADVGSWSHLGVARLEALLYSRKPVRCEVM